MTKLVADTSRFLFTAGDTGFWVVKFAAQEGISILYEVRLELAAEEDIPLDAVIGKSGVLTIINEDKDRFFHGSVHEFYQTGVSGRFRLYEALLMPQAALLDHRRDCRIFQHQDVTQIVTQVLQDAGLTADLYAFRLQNKYPRREYCVQYRESDLHFIRRLLAEEGIFFFFEQSQDNHRMVFGDSVVNYQPISGNSQVPFNPGASLVAEQEAVTVFKRGCRILSGKYAQRDYNFEKPSLDMTTCDQSDENHNLECYDYPGIYTLPEQGRRLTQVRLQQTLMDKDQAIGRSVAPRLMPGFTFSLTGGHTDGHDDAYLLVKLTHEGRQPQVLAERSNPGKGTSYVNDFTAVPATVVIRPNGDGLHKPTVRGVQTAIVTGPAGEEIYTDRHGRIKVQFHWDRQGRRDEQSSCWLRVSQGWAGAGWGAMFIPRIGQEVVVTFLEGDPDRPLISGRVYHGDNLPPYDLPANKTVSTLKSLSSPGGEGFNEIRFEDKKGSEQFFMHAQKDMHVRVKNQLKTFVGNDAHAIIKKDLFDQVDGTRHLTTKGDKIEQVGKASSLNVGQDRQEKVGANFGLEAGREIHITAGTNLVIEAGDTITVKAGAGFITVDQSGVAISGPLVKINSGGSPGSGRGIKVQTPGAAQEAANSRPGSVEKNPAADPRPALATRAAASAPAASPATTAKGPGRADAPERKPEENLLAQLQRENGTFDKFTAFKAGYDINGPGQMVRPEGKSGRYSTLTYYKTPPGSYSLTFKGFDTEHETLKH